MPVVRLCSLHNVSGADSVSSNKGAGLTADVAYPGMELVLSFVALASFIAMVAAWVSVPHPGEVQRASHAAPEPSPTHALGLN